MSPDTERPPLPSMLPQRYTPLDTTPDEPAHADSQRERPPPYTLDTSGGFYHKLEDGVSPTESEGRPPRGEEEEEEKMDIPAVLILFAIAVLCILSLVILTLFSVIATCWGYVLLQVGGAGLYAVTTYLPMKAILLGSAICAVLFSVVLGAAMPALVPRAKRRGLFPLVRGVLGALAVAGIFVNALGIGLLPSEGQAALGLTEREALELSAAGTVGGIFPVGLLLLYWFSK